MFGWRPNRLSLSLVFEMSAYDCYSNRAGRRNLDRRPSVHFGPV